MRKLKSVSLVILVLFYLVAGANHFRSPASYIKIIPSYLPYPTILNYLAGFCEIGFAILLIFSKTRAFAAWGIILMLIAFLPVHICMIQRRSIDVREPKRYTVIGLGKIADFTTPAYFVGMVVYF